eukprot:SAG25_NODE_6325_length_569_cov_1.023404_1_plen_21_part_10
MVSTHAAADCTVFVHEYNYTA